MGVKKVFVVLIVLIIILLIFVLGVFKKKEPMKKSNYDSVSNEKKNELDTLDRFTYKEGFFYENLSDEIKDYITGNSFPENLKDNTGVIGYDDLRYVEVRYYTFEGKEKSGRMIVNKLVALDTLKIFYELYLEKYPFTSIELIEKFDTSDEKSMTANNTSCFCYRNVEMTTKLSWHAFGLAIDINPLYNPYVVSGNVYPEAGYKYADRSKDFVAKITHDDLAYKVFTKYGWKWGGDFINSKDYQHFYKEVLEDNVREG